MRGSQTSNRASIVTNGVKWYPNVHRSEGKLPVCDPAVDIKADQAAQAANYSNYDSLLAEINLIKRRLSRAR